MQSIFTDIKPDEFCWTTSFTESPTAKGGAKWTGKATYLDSVDETPFGNSYFSVSALRKSDKGNHRRRENFSRLHCVVLDDANKCDLSPSWKLETSPNNYQVGFILDEPIEDIDVAARLHSALGDLELIKVDPSGNNVVRYVRLPVGVNTKYEGAPPHRLALWTPDLRVNLRDFCESLGINYQGIIQGSPKPPKSSPAQRNGDYVPDARYYKNIASGESFHDSINIVAARLNHRGMSESNIIETLQGVMEISNDGSERWQSRYNDIERSVRTAVQKFPRPNDNKDVQPNVVSAQNFISELVAPEYVWRQILRKGWLYALTANPGAGKTSIALLMALKFAQGKPLHGNLTMKSRVLYLCGENPDDVRLRFERMLQEEQISPADIGDSICFTRRPFAIDSATQRQSFIDDVSAFGRFDVCVIDTGHAHSDAEEENDNRAMHDLGQCMRDLGSAIGNPCILALMHPVKDAPRDRLLPRGGSAFGGTIDGVLCVWHEGGVAELFAHSSKFRGRQFDPLRFTLKNVDHPTLKDNFGFPANTVIASPELAQSIVEQRMTEATEIFFIKQEVLAFVRRIIDEGNYVSKGQATTSKYIFCKEHRTHTAFPKSLSGDHNLTNKKRLAIAAIESLEEDGTLVYEERMRVGHDKSKPKDGIKAAYWISERRRQDDSENPF
jgi:hypothetical protein